MNTILAELTQKSKRPVRVWLLIGLTMIFFQVVLGGITRLTGSGLSITKWDIVTGTVPPLSETAWHKAYDLYKATPQYKIINLDMTLNAFKRIYFWEYAHRLWARIMGFVFIGPLFYFLRKRWISKRLKVDLWIVFLLAALVAAFGWVMVASGLMQRPWVNAYKLMLHLSLAIFLFEFLLITYLKAANMRTRVVAPFGKNSRLIFMLLLLVAFQMMVGGLMAGMKAGFAYASFPKMNGEWIPKILLEASAWTLENMKAYDAIPFAKALVQFVHRMMGYSIFMLTGWLIWRMNSRQADAYLRKKVWVIGFLVSLQVVLGIYTVLGCQYGKVPLFLGVLHQSVGLLTLSSVVFVWWLGRTRDNKSA